MVTCSCGIRTDIAAGVKDASIATCPACGETLEDLSASRLGVAVTAPMKAMEPPPELARGTLDQLPGQLPNQPLGKVKDPILPKGAKDSFVGRVFAPSLTAKSPGLPRGTLPSKPLPARPQRIWPFVVGGTLLVGAVAGLLYLGLRAPDAREHVVDEVVTPPTPPGPIAPIGPATPEALVGLERDAIAHGDRTALLAILEPGAFAFGTDGPQVAYGNNAVASTILGDLARLGAGPYTVSSSYSRIATEGEVAWITDDLVVSANGRTASFTTSQLAVQIQTRWAVVAWHWGTPVPNALAASLARADRLPPAAPIRDSSGAANLRAAFERAFSSRKQLYAAVSTRADAISIGSAPSERWLSGGLIRRWLWGSNGAEVKIHDGIAVGLATEHAGWGAANVDLSLGEKDPLVQTFRVLAVLLEDTTGWHVVQIHWSNAGPIK